MRKHKKPAAPYCQPVLTIGNYMTQIFENIVLKNALVWLTMSRLLVIGATAGITATATLSQAQVKPPPLPPGSAQLRVEAGLDPNEAARQLRAHHHKFHHRKDITRDDTVHGDPSQEEVSLPLKAVVGSHLDTQSPFGADKTSARVLPASVTSKSKTSTGSNP